MTGSIAKSIEIAVTTGVLRVVERRENNGRS
jgi:hypothetical protein